MMVMSRERAFSGRHRGNVVAEPLSANARADETHFGFIALRGFAGENGGERPGLKGNIVNIDDRLGHKHLQVIVYKLSD